MASITHTFAALPARTTSALVVDDSDAAEDGGARPAPHERSSTVGAAAAGAVIGAALAGGTRAVTGARSNIVLGAAVGTAALGLVNALAGYRPGQRIVHATYGSRHELLFVARHLRHPSVAFDARSTFRDAQQMQRREFGAGRHTDDGVDAVRHAWGSAMFSSRLMSQHGVSADAARQIVADAGDAHERDGSAPASLGSAMDRRNNRTGAALGADFVTIHGRAPTPDELVGVVRRAYDAGLLVVVDPARGELRPSRAGELPLARSANGARR